VALAVFHDIEQGSVAAMFHHWNRSAAAHDDVGQEVGSNVLAGGEDDRPLNYVFQLAHVSRPRIGK